MSERKLILKDMDWKIFWILLMLTTLFVQPLNDVRTTYEYHIQYSSILCNLIKCTYIHTSFHNSYTNSFFSSFLSCLINSL